ncbi:MAG: UvrD-helicase domain-containing protein, partial [Polyangiaceae bacterium]|nr:UvrD-helicase domain-containing protein [Polyangiaceae bacterium]
MIGDPKQAIYGFRGANVHVYLKAKRDTGDRTSTITTNYRSDQRLVEALNHLLNREGIFGEQANAIQEALGNAGVPAVLMGADSVLASPEAYELQLWLEALARTGHDSAARAAVTPHIFGRDAGLLAKLVAEEPAALQSWEVWTDRLVRWRKRFEDHGVLSTLRRALEEDLYSPDGGEPQDATARLLRRPDGQSRLTNLRPVRLVWQSADSCQLSAFSPRESPQVAHHERKP